MVGLLAMGAAKAQPDSVGRGSKTRAALQPNCLHELLITSDNDNYALRRRDGYYTNGLVLAWNHAVNPWRVNGKRQKVIKAVQGVHIGQKIYNPVRFDSINPANQDRPFAGYLFASYDRRTAYAHGGLLQWSATLGTIGPRSLAQQVQNGYHEAINIYPVRGWPTQLRNEASLNLGILYTKSLMPGMVEQRHADVAYIAAANLGNALTNASAALLLRVGRMQGNHNTVQWHTRVSRGKVVARQSTAEMFGFVQPMLTAQAYQAVLQGGLFLRNKGPVTAALEPLVFSLQAGFKYAYNRCSINLHYLYRGKEAKGQLRSESLVGIELALRFGNAN